MACRAGPCSRGPLRIRRRRVPAGKAAEALDAVPTSGGPIGGTLVPKSADERGWGWQVKAMMNPATPRPFYNRAKEAAAPGQADHQLHDLELQPRALLRSRASTSTTSGSRCSTARCRTTRSGGCCWHVRARGAAPMIRMPDALESSIQKATDLGAIGIIVPDGGRRARGARRGAVLALSAVRPPQLGRRLFRPGRGPSSTTARRSTTTCS